MSTVPSTNGATPAPTDPAALAGRDLDPITIGKIMAMSGLFPDITRASQAVVKILAGRELGIGPFAAMSDIHLIDGAPVVGARILAALVRQSGVYDYRVVEWSNERVAIDFYRHGEKLEPTVTFTDDDARRAGLDQPTRDGRPSNHTRFPRNMKFARAISNGVGLHCQHDQVLGSAQSGKIAGFAKLAPERHSRPGVFARRPTAGQRQRRSLGQALGLWHAPGTGQLRV